MLRHFDRLSAGMLSNRITTNASTLRQAQCRHAQQPNNDQCFDFAQQPTKDQCFDFAQQPIKDQRLKTNDQ